MARFARLTTRSVASWPEVVRQATGQPGQGLSRLPSSGQAIAFDLGSCLANCHIFAYHRFGRNLALISMFTRTIGQNNLQSTPLMLWGTWSVSHDICTVARPYMPL